MKLFTLVVLSALLAAGCSDSATSTVQGGISGSETEGQSTGGSDDNSGESSVGQGATGGAGAPAESGDAGSGTSSAEQETPTEAGPALYAFSGVMYQYATVQSNGDATNDPRTNAIQLAPDHVAAQAAIEAKHALSFYKPDLSLDAKIYQISDIQASCNSLDGGFASGFAQERCRHYVQMAFEKTLAQDQWQAVVTDLYAGPTICEGSSFDPPREAGNFIHCHFLLDRAEPGTVWSSSHGMDFYFHTSLRTSEISPIERWSYIQNYEDVGAINRAVTKHSFCAGNYAGNYRPSGSMGWLSSFWPGQHYTLWIVNGDALGDIGEEITAQTPFSRECNSQLIRELGAIYLQA